MKKEKKYIKVILWLVIIVSGGVLISSSFRQIRRFEKSKDLESLNNISIEGIPNVNIKKPEKTSEIKTYSTIPNPQKKLVDQNSDYQGWLLVKGSKIDYPVVQAIDNKYYLDRDFFKEKSEAGSIFMDYRNVGNFQDRHLAMYGHYWKNGNMFGDLHKYKDKDFTLENNIISFKSLYSQREYEIFSVYVDSADDYELEFKFKDDEEYKTYIQKLNERSIHPLEIDIDTNKSIISLATCSYEVGNGRLIVHGVEK